MKSFKNVLAPVFAAGLLGFCASAHAVTLVDANDWKVSMGGFVETDVVHDTTRSFNEVIGNGGVQRPGTMNGENGRTTFSGRNSRLSFTVLPPVQDDWKTKGYLEMDFLGYEPDTTGTPSVSESAFYSNPAIRIRHSYMNAMKNDWTFLAGQTWSLFGWQPNYTLSTVSVAPGPGIMYQRTLQLGVMKAMDIGETSKLQAGLSIERPSQRDSELPNVNLGLRYSTSSRKSGFASASGDINAEPMAIALTGTFRQYETASDDAATTPSAQKYRTNASAVAADLLIPIIASDDGKDTSHTLSFTAEYTTGSGYGDEMPSWSGGLAAFPQGTGGTSVTNLDKGIAGINKNDGSFALVQLQTWSTQLQYHFSQESGAFMTLGYSQASSNNIDQMTIASAAAYDKTQMAFLNIMEDLTKQIRVGAEYERITTHYLNDTTVGSNNSPNNDRVQLSAYFRF